MSDYTRVIIDLTHLAQDTRRQGYEYGAERLDEAVRAVVRLNAVRLAAEAYLVDGSAENLAALNEALTKANEP